VGRTALAGVAGSSPAARHTAANTGAATLAVRVSASATEPRWQSRQQESGELWWACSAAGARVCAQTVAHNRSTKNATRVSGAGRT